MSITIKIYGKTSCPWCDRAKDLASRYGFEYEYFDIGRKQYYDQLKEAVPDLKSVPQIFWHDRHIGGYNELVSELKTPSAGLATNLFS